MRTYTHIKGDTSDHYQAHLRTHTTLQHHTIARDYTITLDRTMCLVFFPGQRILRNCLANTTYGVLGQFPES